MLASQRFDGHRGDGCESAPIFGDAKTCDAPASSRICSISRGMQLVVDRDDDALGRPDREHQLDDLGAVLAGDRDSRAPGPNCRIDAASRSARSRSSSQV